MFDNSLFQVDGLIFKIALVIFGILIIARFFSVLICDQSIRKVGNSPRRYQNRSRYRRYSNRARSSAIKHSRNINQDTATIPLNVDPGAFINHSVAPVDGSPPVAIDIPTMVAVDVAATAVTAVMVGIDTSLFSD